MEREIRECLNCGQSRLNATGPSLRVMDECPRCGYLGWASPSSLDEDLRKQLRDRPLELRARRVVGL